MNEISKRHDSNDTRLETSSAGHWIERSEKTCNHGKKTTIQETLNIRNVLKYRVIFYLSFNFFSFISPHHLNNFQTQTPSCVFNCYFSASLPPSPARWPQPRTTITHSPIPASSRRRFRHWMRPVSKTQKMHIRKQIPIQSITSIRSSLLEPSAAIFPCRRWKTRCHILATNVSFLVCTAFQSDRLRIRNNNPSFRYSLARRMFIHAIYVSRWHYSKWMNPCFVFIILFLKTECFFNDE